MNKENDVQTLSVSVMVLIIFPDNTYFALEFIYAFHPGYFWSFHSKMLKSMGVSGIQTQGSHWVS